MNSRSYNNGMKLDLIKSIEKILDVASDYTRLKILFCLFNEHNCHDDFSNCGNCECKICFIEKCVGDIVKEIDCSQSLVSHQLKVLKDAKLIKSRKEGTKVFYSLADGHIKILLRVMKEHVLEEINND